MSGEQAGRLHEAFDLRAAASPGRTFLHLPEGEVDYGTVAAQAEALADELRWLGVQPGDRVMVLAENCPQHVALLIACSRVGAWSCGVNARMAPGEVDAFVAKADPRCVYFTDGASEAAARHGARLGAQASAVAGLSRAAARPQAQAETGPLRERVAAIIFTSGTTGTPKGVTVTHDGLMHFGRISAASRRLGPDDRSYAFLPMTHIFGLGTVLAASLVAGASLVMRTGFDPADLMEALSHGRVSQLQGPPTMFARLLAWLDDHAIEQVPCPQLRYLYTGAGPLDLPLKRRVEARFGQPLHHGYGLSEYAGSVAVTALGEHRDDTSAGQVVEGAELQVVGPDGRALAPGERGEFWMRGRGLMAGYFRDPAATAEVMRPGGWYASGDLGRIDADGAVFVQGRLKDMIIRSGFNVYPGEVELALQAHPSIRSAAVTGRPEADGNEEVLAFVTLRPGQVLDRAALDAHLREQLAPYKRPARITVVDELPMTHSGKVIKRALLDLLPAEPV
jgi:acyl-CoA synthetase (AMP-forming)/AMP-acid ligase II